MIFQKVLGEFSKKLCRKGLSEYTIQNYIKQTKRIFKDCWKIENWQTITAKEIENWIFSNKRFSNWTRNVYAVQIRAFLKFCRSLDLPVINPEQIAVQKYQTREAKYLNNEDEKRLLEFIKAKNINPNLRAAILLMLTTWTRISETCNLTKQKFREASFIEGMYQIPILGKWNKTRAIFIPPKIYDYILKTAEKHKKKTVIPINTHQIQRMIKEISKEIEIVFTAHTLRHTYCTKLAKKGISLYQIQKLAGHNCIITTSRYLHTQNIELARISGMIANINY